VARFEYFRIVRSIRKLRLSADLQYSSVLATVSNTAKYYMSTTLLNPAPASPSRTTSRHTASGVLLGLAAVVFAGVSGYFLFVDRGVPIFVFKGISGPQDRSVVLPARAAEWKEYGGSGAGRMAVLLTDPDSEWGRACGGPEKHRGAVLRYSRLPRGITPSRCACVPDHLRARASRRWTAGPCETSRLGRHIDRHRR